MYNNGSDLISMRNMSKQSSMNLLLRPPRPRPREREYFGQIVWNLPENEIRLNVTSEFFFFSKHLNGTKKTNKPFTKKAEQLRHSYEISLFELFELSFVTLENTMFFSLVLLMQTFNLSIST